MVVKESATNEAVFCSLLVVIIVENNENCHFVALIFPFLPFLALFFDSMQFGLQALKNAMDCLHVL